MFLFAYVIRSRSMNTWPVSLAASAFSLVSPDKSWMFGQVYINPAEPGKDEIDGNQQNKLLGANAKQMLLIEK
jgi:hypothetical protein